MCLFVLLKTLKIYGIFEKNISWIVFKHWDDSQQISKCLNILHDINSWLLDRLD